jgi:hypothetical protein
VRRFIAEGGYAWVFEVSDPKFTARRLALKMLKPETARGDEFRRFEEEARMIASFDHPNLVTIFDFGRDEELGCNYYTMNFVDGPSLAQKGRLSFEEAAPLFAAVLSGLAQLHDAGIVHRDVKPQNVLIDQDGRARLADLGIARSQRQAQGLTRTGFAVGTARYMSPEQARGRPVGPPSDVFSMGLMMYHVLTGKTVYENVPEIDSTSDNDIMMYIGSLIHSGSELTMAFPPEVPVGVRELIRRACSFDPERRYANAREMRAALRLLLERPAERRLPSRRVLLAAGASLLTLAVIGVYLQTWYTRSGMLERSGEVNALAATAADLLRSVTAAQPPPPADLLNAVSRELELASTFQSRGQEELSSENYSTAETSFDLATRGFERGCQQLLDGHLTGRVAAAVDAVRKSARELEAIDAPRMGAGRWEALGRLLAELEKPLEAAPACATGARQRERLDLAGEATQLAFALMTDVRAEWPQLAGVVRERAVAAQAAATRDAAEAPEYEQKLAAAREAFAEGTRADQSGAFLEAREAFQRAEDLFREAERIVPAAQARAAARAMERDAAARQIEDLGVVSRVVSEAEARWLDGAWEEASQSYGRALALYETRVTQSRGVLELAKRAEQSRQGALDAGAGQSARSELDAAEAQFGRAREALEGERWDEAAQGYQAAAQAFTLAASASERALSQARAVREQASTGREVLPEADCSKLAAPAAAACQEALAALERGDAALAGRDAPAASSEFADADAAFAEAHALQQQALDASRKPPVLVARSPADASLSLHRGERVELRVEATDPNEDPLHYRWTVDGEPTGGDAAKLELAAQTPALVAVEVDDGAGGRLTERWQIELRNRAPELALTPGDEDLGLDVGGRLAFRARATDPDQDAVAVVFFVDGQQVAEGNAFEFEAKRPGSYVVAARASDPAGGVASVERRVEVHPPAPPPNRKPVLTLAAGGTSLTVGERHSFEVEASDPDGDAVTTRFLVDGREVGEGSAFSFVPERPGSHVLTVRGTDAKGATASVERKIAVRAAPAPPVEPANRQPTLRLASETGPLGVGKTRTFRATASDPDGDALEVTFFLDGKRVAEGGQWSFTPRRAARHVVSARATDARGASASAEQRVEVIAAPEPPPARPPATGTAAVPTAKPAASVPALDPDATAQAVLEQYRVAYESKDIATLRRIYLMNDQQTQQMTNFFEAADDVKLALAPRNAKLVGDTISVDFDQRVRATGVRTPDATIPLRATLSRQGDDRWVIVDIRGR